MNFINNLSPAHFLNNPLCTLRGGEPYYLQLCIILNYNSLIYNSLIYIRASLVAPLVKNLPAMQETLVQSLG